MTAVKIIVIKNNSSSDSIEYEKCFDSDLKLAIQNHRDTFELSQDDSDLLENYEITLPDQDVYYCVFRSDKYAGEVRYPLTIWIDRT
jgi:hypothetical protein